ncbi:hypothetical protein DRP07_02615 [Archaeoglobales archaeon]|nr:MAG: hypothetical protein DRP07_02615 [Archaeoglobales archaeon]
MLVIGIDAATWDIIKPNLHRLRTFAELIEEGEHKTITLKQKPWSPSVWCSMFCGLPPEKHGHYDYVKDGEVLSREDINVKFIWDLLDERGISVKALNIPFVVPPYNFNVEFEPVANGLPIEEHELLEEIEKLTEKSLEILQNNKPEVFIVVYTALDRLSHLHWGEPILVDYYEKIDKAIGKLIKFDQELVIISDHGFCDYDKAPIRTLPKKTPRGEIKGDHHPDAILITKNIGYDINQPEDVFWMLYKKYLSENSDSSK